MGVLLTGWGLLYYTNKRFRDPPKLLLSLRQEGSHVCQGVAHMWIIGFREGKVGWKVGCRAGGRVAQLLLKESKMKIHFQDRC